MRKILCILAILALFVPAFSLAESTDVAPATAADPGAIPDSALYIIGDATDHLALAYATHNFNGVDAYMTTAGLRLLYAIGATDKNDVKVMAHFDIEERTAGAKVMIRPDCLDKKLEADVKAHVNDEGQPMIDVKIKGDLTEQQQAYVQALVQKVENQVPGIVIKVKYL
jgi:hypothetical protein